MGDCLELMADIPDGSVDMVLTDLPYGVSKCAWDIALPLGELWAAWHRVCKPNAVAALFGVPPFTSMLVSSNLTEFSHMQYWRKNNVTGHLNARKQPMRCIEEISVFQVNRPSKNNRGRHMVLREYMRGELAAAGLERRDIDRLTGTTMASHWFTMGGQFALPSREWWAFLQERTGRFARDYDDVKREFDAGKLDVPATYNPQGVVADTRGRVKRNQKGTASSVYDNGFSEDYRQTRTGYPTHLVSFDREKNIQHPTQKPVALLEYLIKTYSNAGDTVLDCTMGVGSTGVAAVNVGRSFIGMELDADYYRIAEDRIGDAVRAHQSA